MSLVDDAVDVLMSRRDIYDKAEAYYEGTMEEKFASQKIASLLSGAMGDYRVNFAAVPVDAVHDRIELTAVTGESEQARQVIDQTFERNDLMIDANDIHRWALVYGDAYLMAWPDESGEYIQLEYNSPKNVTVIYSNENPQNKEVAVKVWTVKDDNGKRRNRLNLYLPDRIDKYISAGTGKGQWRQYDESVENPFGEIPVFHFRTARPYGNPEHRRAYGAQDAINKLVATQMDTVDYQSAPQRYALAQRDAQEVTDFDEKKSDRENVGRLKSGPGELWYLKGVTNVGQFSPADPAVFLAPIKEYMKAMSVVTQTPLVYFERTGHMPSGEALRVAEAPLTKKVKNRKELFSASWRQVFRFVLRAHNLEEDVQVRWVDAESVDRLTELDVVLKKIEAGVPTEQALAEYGYDTEMVSQWNTQSEMEE